MSMKILFAGVVMALVAAAPSARAVDGGDASEQLRRLKLATAPFNSIDVARAAGWAKDITGCLSSPEGGMGHHYANEKLLSDHRVDPMRPELLVYAPTRYGGRRLVAVEFLVFREALGTRPVPSLFGQPFHFNPAVDAYVLHVWQWQSNPSGLFADWNPNVRCP